MKNLPHDLLLHIFELSLPLMKTRAAVQTCILIKGWNHLWPYFSGLDFDLSEFNTRDPEQDEQKFFHFVTRMLECHRAAKVNKFRLSCVNFCKKKYALTIEKWIMYALQHQVKVLELTVCSGIRNLITQCIAASNSLEELHLHLNECGRHDRILSMPDVSINSHTLQKLHLHIPGMMCGDLFTNLISGCPLLKDLWLESVTVLSSAIIRSENLEHLTFKNCKLTGRYETETKKINLPRLHKLSFLGGNILCHCILELISGCPLLEDLWVESLDMQFEFIISLEKLQNLTFKNCKCWKISIEAPSLVSFYFVGPVATGIFDLKLGSLSSFTTANSSLRHSGSESYILNYNLEGLSYAKHLELCAYKVAANLQSPPYHLTLYNLQSLSFCGHCFKYIFAMCKDMPNLEKITLWPNCQHSLWFPKSIKWDDALFGLLIRCKKLKEVEVVAARFIDQEKQLDGLCKIKMSKINCHIQEIL
ncbi:hypothetical protein LUZ62_059817 [Rhynchospora pubera]|uniref:F-box domain-containing protein n=1 Tax=Rhynchospora pubera TaxID=906938 RepID=A0AAV8E7V5_9POAL|nr:hypothetical protein LUZ62_059817 [Rhynchospora pubera]